MQKSALLELIRSLDRKEIRALKKWLHSPAHNLREDVAQLFEYLAKQPADNEENVEKARVWEVLFPGKPFDDAYLRQVMYFLLQQIENFLIFQEILSNDSQKLFTLMQVYRKRQLSRVYKMTMEAAKKKQQSFAYRNSDYLKQQHLLEEQQYYYLSAQKWSINQNLQETANALDASYVAEKLRLSCLMLSHQFIYKKVSYDMGALESMLAHIENSTLIEEVAIAAYYYGYKALTDRENEQHYEELEKLIRNKGHLFSPEELGELYLMGINYCVSRINLGHESYQQKTFNLYKNGFENNILLDHGTVSKITFNNAVSAAIKVKEFAWAENFINNFQNRLEEKHRESIVNFSLSRLYFERGEFKKAQLMLLKFEYDDMVLNLVAKTMLLKIYYEEGEYSAFESLTESMRSYLQRKEAISPNHRLVYKNLLSIMRKLINLNPYSKTQREKFRELVMNTNPLTEREWLLKQLNK